MIRRDQIAFADYNPRSISKDARKRLKKGLAQHGMVTTLVWNRRTGNLVSGHQRLSILDELEKSQDYSLNVAVIDVSLEEEKKLNVQINNPSMQGEWDMEGLSGLIEGDGISPLDLGFSETEVSLLTGDGSRFAEMLDDNPDVAEAKGTLRKIKAERGEAASKMKEAQGINNYFVVVCESESQRRAMLKKLGIPDYEDHVNGRILAPLLGV